MKVLAAVQYSGSVVRPFKTTIASVSAYADGNLGANTSPGDELTDGAARVAKRPNLSTIRGQSKGACHVDREGGVGNTTAFRSAVTLPGRRKKSRALACASFLFFFKIPEKSSATRKAWFLP